MSNDNYQCDNCFRFSAGAVSYAGKTTCEECIKELCKKENDEIMNTEPKSFLPVPGKHCEMCGKNTQTMHHVFGETLCNDCYELRISKAAMNTEPTSVRCKMCDDLYTLHSQVCGESFCGKCWNWIQSKKTAVAVPSDPKGAAGKMKDQLQLIPTILEKETAKALDNGSKKYQPFNWRFCKVESMTYIGAIRRHLNAYFDGEELDPESGAHHLGHIAANCSILMDAEDQGTLIDNRPVNNKTKKP